MEADLITRLLTSAAVKATLTNGDSPPTYRIYADRLPQKPTYPAGVYGRVSAVHEHSHDGIDGLCTARMQFDFYSPDHTTVKNLAEAVRLALDGYKGTTGSTTFGSILLDSDLSDYEPPPEALYRRSMDFMVNFEEAKS